MRAKSWKNLEVTNLEKRSRRVSVGEQAKKSTNEEQRHGSSYKYGEIETNQGTSAIEMITEWKT